MASEDGTDFVSTIETAKRAFLIVDTILSQLIFVAIPGYRIW